MVIQGENNRPKEKKQNLQFQVGLDALDGRTFFNAEKSNVNKETS